MPGFDRRGPNFDGPMTGRGLGNCSQRTGDVENQKQENASENAGATQRFDAPGIGYGRGRGMGPGAFCRGRRRGFGRGRW